MIPKFRAYINMHKKIVDVQEINYKHKEIVWENGRYLEVDFFSDIELLQSTELLDKNGKEIYEGHIVNVHAFYFDGCSEAEKEHIGIIHYGNIAGFLIKEWYLETSDNKIAFSDLELHEESFEILGNEFENKELLGEGK